MKLKDLLKVVPFMESIQIDVINKKTRVTISSYTFLKERIPDEYLCKRVCSVTVNDWTSELLIYIFD